MTVVTIKIPDGKTSDVSSFVKSIGGEIVIPQKDKSETHEEGEEVTHEVFFGENIKRVISAFRNKNAG